MPGTLALKPAAIVLDGEMHAAAVARKFDRDARGARMPGDVGQRLLHDAKQVRLGLIGEPSVKAGFVVHLDAGALAKPLSQPADARVQAEVVENRGPQQVRKLADILDRLIDQPAAIFQARRIGRRRRIERGHVGFDRRERLAELIVQFMRETPRRRFLAFQHVPGDARQIGRLLFHPVGTAAW